MTYHPHYLVPGKLYTPRHEQALVRVLHINSAIRGEDWIALEHDTVFMYVGYIEDWSQPLVLVGDQMYSLRGDVVRHAESMLKRVL